MKTADEWRAAIHDALGQGPSEGSFADDILRDYARLETRQRSLLAIAVRFVELYGAGGPEYAFDTLEIQATHAIEQAMADAAEDPHQITGCGPA